jgi:hypothetical protein
MTTLFRAAAGFLIALGLLNGQVPAPFRSPAVAAVKRQIDSGHPAERLLDAVKALVAGGSAQNGTGRVPKPPKRQARLLQR